MRHFATRRLLTNPIITPHMDERMGSNINGPSLVRVPDWVANPLGRYYLYFADHNGSYIRMAYADEISGPWHMYTPGTLQIADSHFPLDDIEAPPVHLRLLVESSPHIASPDVHLDDERREFRMYYHGIQRDRTQVTRLATSPDGIHFTGGEEVFGPSYFRVFRYAGEESSQAISEESSPAISGESSPAISEESSRARGWWYALVMPGVFYRSPDGMTGFERGPKLFSNAMRHSAVMVEGDELVVFYTNAGDTPERIFIARIDLRNDWMAWQESAAELLLEPETAYEGIDCPLEPSVRGGINARARQLRDPAIYRENDRTWLLYCVAGESGIALAELSG